MASGKYAPYFAREGLQIVRCSAIRNDIDRTLEEPQHERSRIVGITVKEMCHAILVGSRVSVGSKNSWSRTSRATLAGEERAPTCYGHRMCANCDLLCRHRHSDTSR